MMSMTARRAVPCSTRLMVPSLRSPAMAHTTRAASTARSLPVIPKPRSSCHRGRMRCRARPPRPRPLRVTGICKRLPNMAAWVGRKASGTTGVPWWKPISAAGNGSSVMRCARKPTSVKQPKWHSLSTSSTACWRWDAQATSASYETTRTRDHCVHRLIHATRSFQGHPARAEAVIFGDQLVRHFRVLHALADLFRDVGADRGIGLLVGQDIAEVAHPDAKAGLAVKLLPECFALLGRHVQGFTGVSRMVEPARGGRPVAINFIVTGFDLP